MQYSPSTSSSLKKFSLLISLTSVILSFSACGNGNNYSGDSTELAGNLRTLSQNERAQDFDQFIALFKTYYGPYDYKQKIINVSIDSLAASLRDQAVNSKSDEEFAGYIKQIGAALKDGHVQLSVKNTSSGVSRYSIPVLLTQVEDKILVASVDAALSKEMGIEKGDEVLSVDGKTPQSYLPVIAKYDGWATKSSEVHSIYNLLSRPSYMTELVPKDSSVVLKIKKADDSTAVKEVPWVVRKYNADLDKMVKPSSPAILDFTSKQLKDRNAVVSTVDEMGNDDPFFVTTQSQKKYNFIKAYPSDAARKKAELGEKDTPPIYGALYKYGGKNILLVRIASYSPSDYSSATYMKAYKALLTEYQDMADVLVLDQTHNPGGSYCASFYELFANEGDRQAVQKCNADRKWINGLLIEWPAMAQAAKLQWNAKVMQAQAAKIEKAYDNNQRLSEALPIFTDSNYADVKQAVWKKPMIVLIDELAGSCGDIFPMLVKANKRAKLFGQQTMGLGGNVENVGTLNHSRISVSMTRGLFTTYKEDGNYLESDFIENNGVMPDISYSHTVKDFRGGFVDYIKTFSDEALKVEADAAKKAEAAKAKEEKK